MEPTTAAVVKGAVEAADKIPFTSIVKQMLGPAADELAEKFRDSIRVYRYGRQLKLLEKAEKMATDAGFTPKAVPIKLLFPLLEGASLEENEDLHTMWAALLANAANPDTPDLVHPSFAGTLKQLAPEDANLFETRFRPVLTDLFRLGVTRPRRNDFCNFILDLSPRYAFAPSVEVVEAHYIDVRALSSLEALGLIDRPQVDEIMIPDIVPTKPDRYILTTRGYEFLIACQPPQPKK